MYRLMMYFLICLVIIAAILAGLQIIPYSPIDIVSEALYLVTVCWIVNKVLAKIFKVKTNPESALITGLILSLIIGPINPFSLSSNWIPAFAGMTGGGVAVLAMASKYLLAWKGKHIFNPVAFGAVASAVLLGQGASWWVGTPWMVVPTLIGGLLVLKKIRRFEMAGIFLITYLLLTSLVSDDFVLQRHIIDPLLHSPILFFALVMLVEPLTSPVTKKMQIIYGIVIAGFILIISRLFTEVYYGLELSLLVGNIFSYVVSGSFRQAMILKEKKLLTHDVIAFQFEPARKFQFKAGQFLEWTLSHKNPDSRGVRRFFTISSSPTEDYIMLTSKFYEKPSTFKQALRTLELGSEIIASSLSGEFTLPEDKDKKLVFIAGGIGITPFRSMVKYMVDMGEKRDLVILYSNKTERDIVFKDIFENAKEFGVRTVYVNTDKDGFIDEKLIKKEVTDFKDRIFYISGPEPMVEAFEKMLGGMGVSRNQIKRDYFPGYTETHQK